MCEQNNLKLQPLTANMFPMGHINSPTIQTSHRTYHIIHTIFAILTFYHCKHFSKLFSSIFTLQFLIRQTGKSLTVDSVLPILAIIRNQGKLCNSPSSVILDAVVS